MVKIFNENDDPAVLSSLQVPTADLGGAVLTVWQSRTGTNTFVTLHRPILQHDPRFCLVTQTLDV